MMGLMNFVLMAGALWVRFSRHGIPDNIPEPDTGDTSA
jgi:hypothetical protein